MPDVARETRDLSPKRLMGYYDICQTPLFLAANGKRPVHLTYDFSLRQNTLLPSSHMHVLQNVYTTWVRAVACQKQRLGPKLEEGWDRGASKKIGTPYVFLQPLNLATSNLVHNLGLGLVYQKTFRTKIGGGLGPGEHPKKNWDPLFISSTVEASD